MLTLQPTHVNTIRIAPPIVISEEDLLSGIRIIGECLAELDTVEIIPGEEGHPEEQVHQNKLDD